MFLLLACDCERKLGKMAAKDEDGNVNDDGKESSNHLLSQGFFLFRSSSSSFTMLFRDLCIYLVLFMQDRSVFSFCVFNISIECFASLSYIFACLHQVDFLIM